jgi:CBS domain-containing protein
MSRPVKTLGPDDSLYAADDLMTRAAVRHLPVVDRGGVVGVLSQRDLLEYGLASALGYTTLGARKLLRALHAQDAMSGPAVTTSPDATLHEAARLMLAGRLGCLPVVEEQRLVGIVTESDLLKGLVETRELRSGGVDGSRRRVSMRCYDVMSRDVVACHEQETVAQCAKTMKERNVGFMPVLDNDGIVVGLVTDRDLAVRVLADAKPPTTRVGAVMTRDVRICRPADLLQSAEDRMASTRKSRLVVVDSDGRCVGVLSLSDIARAEPETRVGYVLHAATTCEMRPTLVPSH